MWSQTSLVVLTLSAVYSFTDFKYQGELPNYTLQENITFGEYYYQENGSLFQPIQFEKTPEDLLYFPKCCPPGYSYEMYNHSCKVANSSSRNLFKDIDVSANLIRTVLDCDLVVDYPVNIGDIYFDEAKQLNFRFNHYGLHQYCVDLDYQFDGITIRVCENIDYCAKKYKNMCIKKCCRDGYMYSNRKCTRDPTSGMNLKSFEHIIENYRGLITSYGAAFAQYQERTTCARYLPDHDNIKYKITQNGSIFLNFTDKEEVIEYPIGDPLYCIDGMKAGDEVIPVLLFCASNEIALKFQLSRIILLTSSIFLFVTIAIHLFTSKLRTLMGKIIICHCACMMASFVVLTGVQFYPSLGDLCKPMGFIIFFAFLATFTWLNVMCYEIWKTFGLMKNTPPEKQKEIFIKYNIYAWSIPTVMLILVVTFNSFRVLPAVIHPFVGETHCIVENRTADGQYGSILFFSLPQALMLLANLVFFVDTLRHYFKMKKELATLQSSDNVHALRKKEKIHKFLTVVKLFVVMGLPWGFEVLSSVVDFKKSSAMATTEMVFDTINCLQGVFVFIIFILNRKTLLRLYKKISCKKGYRKKSADDSFNSVLSSENKQEMAIQPVHA